VDRRFQFDRAWKIVPMACGLVLMIYPYFVRL
jgi:hypothetical protein